MLNHIKERPSRWLTGLICGLIFSAATAQMPPQLPAVPIPQAEPMPYQYTGDPETRDIPFLAWHRPGHLASKGYTEEEILLSGKAAEYEYWDDDGQQYQVQPSASAGTVNYRTRVLIRRPKNPDDFNGVVYLELLNATARYDGAPMWNLTWRSMIEDGAIWAGVTYSDASVNFMRNVWGTSEFPAPSYAQPRNRSRYATLRITTRALTWDIVNQAAALLKQQGNAMNPLQDFPVDTIIMTGYSQSARYITTHANSFAPAVACAEGGSPPDLEIPDCVQVIDGHLVAAGGPNASKLDGTGSHPLGDRRNCELSINREAPCVETEVEPDPNFTALTKTKVMRFTSESDIKSVRVHQFDNDQPHLRTYEAAGTSHADFWGSVVGRGVGKYQFGENPGASSFPCDLELNPLGTGIPLSAIQHNLARWIQDDITPPPSHYIEFEGSFDDDSQAWVRDADDNVLGGVRPPRIEVPLGSYYGSNQYSGPLPSPSEIFCTGIIGGYIPFSMEEVINRYSNQSTLEALTWWSSLVSYEEGFLRPVDARTIMRRTRLYDGLPD